MAEPAELQALEAGAHRLDLSGCAGIVPQGVLQLELQLQSENALSVCMPGTCSFVVIWLGIQSLTHRACRTARSGLFKRNLVMLIQRHGWRGSVEACTSILALSDCASCEVTSALLAASASASDAAFFSIST